MRAVGLVRTAKLGAMALAVGAMLGACASDRLASTPRAAVRAKPVAPAEPAPVVAIPADPVTSEPLPPPPGSGAAPPAVVATAPTAAPDFPVAGGNPSATPRAAEPAPAPIASASPSRSASVGSWTARDATGATCRVSLTGTPALDLYRANAGGCTNRDLAKVTAWDFRDGEVYLYQPGGSVVARLRSDGSSLQGVLSKSGAPLNLSRS